MDYERDVVQIDFPYCGTCSPPVVEVTFANKKRGRSIDVEGSLDFLGCTTRTRTRSAPALKQASHTCRRRAGVIARSASRTEAPHSPAMMKDLVQEDEWTGRAPPNAIRRVLKVNEHSSRLQCRGKLLHGVQTARHAHDLSTSQTGRLQSQPADRHPCTCAAWWCWTAVNCRHAVSKPQLVEATYL